MNGRLITFFVVVAVLAAAIAAPVVIGIQGDRAVERLYGPVPPDVRARVATEEAREMRTAVTRLLLVTLVAIPAGVFLARSRGIRIQRG